MSPPGCSPTDPQPGESQVVPRDEYTTEALTACEKALRTILAGIGPWGNRIILVGGLVPQYLIPQQPEGIEPHVGSTDIDIVVGVALATGEDEPYRTLARNLAEAGFGEGDHSYRWERAVDGVPVKLEFFCPPGEDGPGRLRRNPGTGVGAAISAIGLRGAELAADDCHEHRLEGETLDHGGHREVTVAVANILPFLVLKAFALEERIKDKDAYDIVWCLTAFDGGPANAAAAARRSPVVEHPDVREGIEHLKRHFASIESAGPALYARFFGHAGPDDDDGVRLKREAKGAVQEFLQAWDAGAD